MLVPLLGPGLLQAVSCVAPTIGGTCAGAGGATPANAFRIGVDGNVAPLPAVTQTLPQPFYPGIAQNGVLNAAAADGSQLDPNFKPNHSDEFTLTIQRQISQKMTIELGYIGRKISNEFQEINLDAVPYMTTLNGQTFASAWANVYNQICAGAGPTCTPNTANVTAQPSSRRPSADQAPPTCRLPELHRSHGQERGQQYQSHQRVSGLGRSRQQSSWTLARSLLAQPGAGQQLTGAFDFIGNLALGTAITTPDSFPSPRTIGTAYHPFQLHLGQIARHRQRGQGQQFHLSAQSVQLQ